MYQDIIKAFKTELKSMTTADNTEQGHCRAAFVAAEITDVPLCTEPELIPKAETLKEYFSHLFR